MSLYSQFTPGRYSNRKTIMREVSRAMEYSRGISRLARQLWRGDINHTQFMISMTSQVVGGLTRAWKMGARDAGIRAGELTTEELNKLAQLIIKEESFIPRFSVFIQQNSKARGGRWATVNARVKMWQKRFIDARNQGRLNAANNPKLMWVIGPAEKHCDSCAKLDGKVKRANQWKEAGLEPQRPPNPMLECGGHNCTCELVPTDEPMSKGRLPRTI